jgi:outer membrane protein OmpA-like peptidoglycan-associated protein
MTIRSVHKLILPAVLAVLAVSGMHAPAMGQATPTPDTNQLIEALRAKSTRGVTAHPEASSIEEDRIIEELAGKATRGLSRPERARLADTVENRPKIDLEINFGFNAADTSPAVRPILTELGRAMTSPEFAGAKFLVAGHTDAKGGDAYNQKLSERRAKAVKQFLTAHFNLKDDQLVVVGYGEERLKNPDQPFADENRRVQVVNISPAQVSSKR